VERQEILLERAEASLAAARRAALLVIFVVVRFREGYPEVSPRNKRFSALKAAGRLREGTSGAEIHARLAPRSGESVVTKRRVGAFSTTDLEAILRAHGITTLALSGIATSGVVLSTVRWAADLDYRLIVLADACADRDDEVHRVLTEKVFPAQATVLSTQAFLGLLDGQPA
jgi:nicotinamidase-related amidase